MTESWVRSARRPSGYRCVGATGRWTGYWTTSETPDTETLARDGWRAKRSLEHYGKRRYWREQNKNQAVWELYDKLVAS